LTGKSMVALRLVVLVFLVTWFSFFVGSVVHETAHAVEAELKGGTVTEICYVGFSSGVFPQYWPPSKHLQRLGLGWIDIHTPRTVFVNSEVSEARAYTAGYVAAAATWFLLMFFLFPLRTYWKILLGQVKN